MDVHQNARLTVFCRVLLVERTASRSIQSDRWPGAGGFGAHGPQVADALSGLKVLSGLEDRASRPRRSPQATGEVLRVAVLALRRQRLTLVTIAAAAEALAGHRGAHLLSERG